MRDKNFEEDVKHRLNNHQCGKVKFPFLISCRNSYQRKLVYKVATELGITSVRTVLDYTRIHVNQAPAKLLRESRCGDSRSDAEYEYTLTATPFSFVEIGRGTQPKKIGSEDMLPPPQTLRLEQEWIVISLGRAKFDMKSAHETLVKRYATTLFIEKAQ